MAATPSSSVHTLALRQTEGAPERLLRMAHRKVTKALNSLMGPDTLIPISDTAARKYERDTLVFALELACREKIYETHPSVGPLRGETPTSFGGGNNHLRMNLRKRVEQIRAAELAARTTGTYQIDYHPTDERHPIQKAKRKALKQQQRKGGCEAVKKKAVKSKEG